MRKFSKKSLERLGTCHPDLIRLFNKVIEVTDCTVLCGFRGEEEQNEAVRQGNSKTPWPKSKHNTRPRSMAVDVAPYPIDWSDHRRFYYFAGVVMGVADSLGISIRFGGDWNGNFNLKDENFFDLVHFELKENPK